MDFAKNLLNKYGWKEGDGLGKKNDGIAKALKPHLKFDKTGLGADLAASDYNNHWWERVYNDAAQNVEVKKQENGVVKMDLKDHDNAVEISTKTYSLKKLKKVKAASGGGHGYENFLQLSTLTGAGGEVGGADNKTITEDIAVNKYKQLTDEELFQACGGRTAHKGARHGQKMSGKIARLEQQDKELLEKMRAKANEEVAVEKVGSKDTQRDQITCHTSSIEENGATTQTKRKRSKHNVVEADETERKIPKENIMECNNVNESETLDSTDFKITETPREKKKSKKHRQKTEDSKTDTGSTIVPEQINVSAEIELVDQQKLSKKKRERRDAECKQLEVNESKTDANVNKASKKKKKNRDKNVE